MYCNIQYGHYHFCKYNIIQNTAFNTLLKCTFKYKAFCLKFDRIFCIVDQCLKYQNFYKNSMWISVYFISNLDYWVLAQVISSWVIRVYKVLNICIYTTFPFTLEKCFLHYVYKRISTSQVANTCNMIRSRLTSRNRKLRIHKATLGQIDIT